MARIDGAGPTVAAAAAPAAVPLPPAVALLVAALLGLAGAQALPAQDAAARAAAPSTVTARIASPYQAA